MDYIQIALQIRELLENLIDLLDIHIINACRRKCNVLFFKLLIFELCRMYKNEVEIRISFARRTGKTPPGGAGGVKCAGACADHQLVRSHTVSEIGTEELRMMIGDSSTACRTAADGVSIRRTHSLTAS